MISENKTPKADNQRNETRGRNGETLPKSYVYDRVTMAYKPSQSALLDAAKWMFGAIERGELVRDIRRDGEPDWVIRMEKFAIELRKAQIAISNAERLLQ